jgi:cytochrome c556
MKFPAIMAAVTFSALSLACVSATSAQDAPAVLVREEMQQQVNPAMLAIWDVTNEALDDEGNFNPALVNDAGWAQIVAQARTLEAAGRRMAAAGSITASAPENAFTEDYELSMSDVQALVDSNPAAFRAFAAAFADQAARLRMAAEAGDGVLVGELAGVADQSCSGCHLTFWAAPEV